MSKEQEWWLYRSPLIKKQLQVKYFPETNYNFLSQTQIQKIYEQEKHWENLGNKILKN
jgi:hypothetical protein